MSPHPAATCPLLSTAPRASGRTWLSNPVLWQVFHLRDYPAEY